MSLEHNSNDKRHRAIL